MSNYFDQFDPAPPQQSKTGNFFDQFDAAPKKNFFDQFDPPPQHGPDWSKTSPAPGTTTPIWAGGAEVPTKQPVGPPPTEEDFPNGAVPMHPQGYAGALLNAGSQGAVEAIGSTVAGIGAFARGAGNAQLDAARAVADKIDAGQKVPQDQDVVGYQFMSPAQRQQWRTQYLSQPNTTAPNAAERWGAQLKQAAQEYAPVAAREEGFGTSVARTGGGFVPLLGAALLGGPEAAVPIIFGQSYDADREAALAKGATPAQAHDAASKGALAQAALMAVPLGSMVARVPEAFRGAVGQTLQNLAKQGIEFGSFAGTSQFVDNLVKKETYDPSQPLMEGVGDAALENTVAGLVVPFGAAAPTLARGAAEAVRGKPGAEPAASVAAAPPVQPPGQPTPAQDLTQLAQTGKAPAALPTLEAMATEARQRNQAASETEPMPAQTAAGRPLVEIDGEQRPLTLDALHHGTNAIIFATGSDPQGGNALIRVRLPNPDMPDDAGQGILRIDGFFIDNAANRSGAMAVRGFAGLIRDALAAGWRVSTDSTLTPDGQRLVARMQQLGFSVWRNPDASLDHDGNLDTGSVAPAYRITGAPSVQESALLSPARSADATEGAIKPDDVTTPPTEAAASPAPAAAPAATSLGDIFGHLPQSDLDRPAQAQPTPEPAAPAPAEPSPAVPMLASAAETPAELAPPPAPAEPAARAPSGAYVMLDPSDLHLDPQRFQYKAADDRGVTGALGGTNRWEPALANPITAWEGNDGNLYVVNGHQRTDLAQRAQAAGQPDVQMPARIFREADGYTPGFMRALGAYQNMAEGTGTALDAARVLRGKNDLPATMKLPDLPPRSALVQQAQGLADLDQRAFGMVESGAVPPAYAAFVGAARLAPAEQIAALDVLRRAQPASAEQARIMVDDIRNSGFLAGAQTTLFGDEALASSLFPERARVLDQAMRALRRYRSVFKAAVEGEDTLTGAGNQLSREGNVAGKTENEQLIDRLNADATKRGPISDALSDAARDVAAGKPVSSAASRFLTTVRSLERRGESEGVQPGTVSGGAGPAEETGGVGRDLLGAPMPERAASRAPEPMIANDERQIGIPGTEPSAVQAQAARDQTGRGAIAAPVEQKPADEGLFAPKQPEQFSLASKLYGGPTAIFDPDVWRAVFSGLPAVLRPMGRAALAASTAAREVSRSIAEGLAPMSGGTVRSKGFAADFANSLRRVQYRYGEIDYEIQRNFSPAERDAMGRALDAQSVFEQQVRDLPADQQQQARADFDASRTGLAGLNEAQQRTLGMLDALSQDVWRRMQERGMVAPDARPIPYYFPRQILAWSEENGFTRAGGQGGAGRGLEARGANLTTAGPMRREHLTPEETEAAARAKLGRGVGILRDIRSLPARLAYSERAIAGTDLMHAIREVGKDTGVDLVVHGDIPGLLNPGDYFTMADHPSFRRWTGTGWQAIHVAREFEQPLKAVLTQRSPTWYRAAMAIKGAVMGTIMWSPFIHLAVELGRALPVMPARVVTLRVLRDGSVARRDLGYMDQATRDGLAPLGRSWQADPVSIADDAYGYSSKLRFVRALANARDAMANGARALGGDVLHDIVQHPHQTLLWDQIFNLQVGIYDGMRQRFIAKGFSPDVAGTMAAQVANRYAGALPSEHLSRGANMAANLLLFSRSFTLGNLGVIKDMMTGAPSHVLARIERMAGPAIALSPVNANLLHPAAFAKDVLFGKSAQAYLRRKAISAFAMDIGFYYMANAMVQLGLQTLRQAPQMGLPAAAQQTFDQWLGEAGQSIDAAAHGNPLAIFGVLPQHWNEPGKQNRVYAGTDANGRGIYLRLPAGKLGEEFLGWFTHPGEMVVNKTSPLVRPIVELALGYDSLGRQLLPPNPQTIGDYIDTAGAIVRHIGENLGPTQTIEGLTEMFKQHILGEPSQADPYVSAMKVIGPATGLAQISSGYPGGPVAGEIHAFTERERYALQHAMPAIRQQIASGDVAGAVQQMTALGVPRGLQSYYIRQTIHPGPSRTQMRQFQHSATPAEVARLRQMQSTP